MAIRTMFDHPFGPNELSMVTVERPDTTVPPAGDIATIVPLATDCEGTLTTLTVTPSPDSSPAAVGVLIPTTFGMVNDTDGHSTLCVTEPSLIVTGVHGTEEGAVPSGR